MLKVQLPNDAVVEIDLLKLKKKFAVVRMLKKKKVQKTFNLSEVEYKKFIEKLKPFV